MGLCTTLSRLGFIGLISLVSLPATGHADQPSHDPTVNALRTRFKKARPPRLEDLAPGRVWDCDYYSAEPGSTFHATFGNSYRFSPNADGTVKVAGDALSKAYVFTSSALVGTKTWGPRAFGEEHLRIGPQGELLVEFGLPECSGLECFYFFVRSACDDNIWEALVGYSECRLQP